MADETRPDAKAGLEEAAFDRAGQDAVEGRKPQEAGQHPDSPPAGPHAAERLTSDVSTPGAGALPSADGQGDVDPGAG